MTTLKLFRIGDTHVKELEGHSVIIERSLQTLIEQNLEVMLGVKLLDSEYAIKNDKQSKINTIGLDENGSPVIIMYQRALNENIIHQGLYYLDWLTDHRANFELLVFKRLGKEYAETIYWPNSRLICIAGDFSKYDRHAIRQISRNIELIQYRQFDIGFLLLELISSSIESDSIESYDSQSIISINNKTPDQKALIELLKKSNKNLFDLFEALKSFLIALGDDVKQKNLISYSAFKRLKNFACIMIPVEIDRLLIYINLPSETVSPKAGLIRNVERALHVGTGDIEITLKKSEDLDKIRPLIIKSYENC